ncbi:MAG: sigma-70 family RNA polymerase sigma factor [Bacteroidales bacterium]
MNFVSCACNAMGKNEKDYIISLWNSFLTGEERTFSVFYDLLFEQLLNYGLHICKEQEVVEDCIQEIFVRIYLREIYPDDPSKIRAFLYKVLKNSVLNAIARNSKTNSIDEENMVFNLSYTIEEQLFAESDMQIRIEQLLASLTEREKEIIYLRYVHEMKIEEIAEIQGIHVQSIRNSLYRSIGKLRKENSLLMIIWFQLLIYNMD